MPSSVFPPQMGFLPSGSNQASQLILGRNTTGTYEGIGVGAGGRPDSVESIQVYVTANLQTPTPTVPLTITIDATSALAIIASNPNAPTVFGFTMQEVATCETDANGQTSEKRRMALISQAYPKAS